MPSAAQLPADVAVRLAEAEQRHASGRLEAAAAIYREVLRLAPGQTEAAANLGAILRRLRRPGEALAIYDACLALEPEAPLVLANRANLLNDLKRWPQALASADRALAVQPELTTAHNARGNALMGLGRFAEALMAFDRAGDAGLMNAGRACLALDRPAEALAWADRAARAAPDAARPPMVRAHALGALGRWGEAVEAYDAAFARRPDEPFLAGYRLHARMRACRWDGFDAAVADLAGRITGGEPASAPFPLVAAPVGPDVQRRCAEAYMAATSAAVRVRTPPPPSDRIRLGYFSADFHDHATGRLLAEVVESHDRSRFEVTAFSFGPDTGDALQTRLKAGFDRFYDVRRMGDADVAAMARGLGVDIAVDLKGHTAGSRPEIFAHGAAPVQVSYLGYPMTLGATFMDWIVADPVLVRPGEERFYAERVARLPACYQPNDRTRRPGPPTRRVDHGLHEDALVLASFNASYKITPEVFGLWMRLLAETPQAVLWLLQDDRDAARNLGREARARGVDPARLVFAPAARPAEHLERLAHADLFLDTWPCSAHTTASDALWAGLPLLTREGDTFAGRVAASVLRASGLPELVAVDADDYLDRARRLAADPAALRAIRRRVAAAREASPVFDTPTYVAALEALYARMLGREP